MKVLLLRLHVPPGAVLAMMITPMITRRELGACLNVVPSAVVLRAFHGPRPGDGLAGPVGLGHRFSGGRKFAGPASSNAGNVCSIPEHRVPLGRSGQVAAYAAVTFFRVLPA
jgi:hypothetical protein